MIKSLTRIFASARGLAAFGMAAAAWAVAGAAHAGGLGEPQPWQIGMQPPVTPIEQGIHNFHNLLLSIIVAIVLLVMVLLLYVVFRFRASVNPVPSKTSHNTLIEVVWTLVPILILVVVAVPSFRLLYAEDRIPPADMSVKVVGHQWYWTYSYPDNGNISFDSLMVQDKDLKPGQPRLLETDNHLVVPVNTTIRVLVTSTDVLHGWYVPALGVQKEAVPGRTNETWFRAEKVGTYYGECTELCGVNHAYMPIVVDVVSKEAFKKWLVVAKKQFASLGTPAERVAMNVAPSATAVR